MTTKEVYPKRSYQSNKMAMECNECKHSFSKVIGKNTYEVKCPKCGSYDTEPK